MDNNMINALLSKAEEWGWVVYEDEDSWNIRQCSPAGEDFDFYVYRYANKSDAENASEFVRQVREYARDFDPNEHVMLWAECSGTRGVPDIKTLVDDAEDINKMLDSLAYELEQELNRLNQSEKDAYMLGEIIYDITTCIPCVAASHEYHCFTYDSRDLYANIFKWAKEFAEKYPDIGDEYMETVEQFGCEKLCDYFGMED